MAQNLTRSALAALAPKAKAYKVTDGGGLHVDVLPSGLIVWRYQFLLNGKRGKVTLAAYRRAGAPKHDIEMTLDDARDRHRELRRMVLKGEDPAAAKQADKRLGRFNSETVKTVADLFDLWFEDIAGRSENSLRTAKGWWEHDIKDAIGHRYVNTVTREDVIALVEKVERRGSPASAQKVAMTIRQAYAFAMNRKPAVAKENPALAIKVTTSAPNKAHRKLEVPEIGPFLRALESDGGREENKLAIRLLMLTLARKDELRLATWAEFDLDNAVWLIPGHRMKQGRAHDVYLPTQAVAILRRLHDLADGSPYLMHHMSTRQKPVGHTTWNNVIDRIDIQGARFVPHGFRATASSILNDAGFRGEVIEKALAHGEANGIRKIYNQASYTLERANMLQWFADYLDALQQSEKVVIPMRFKPLKDAA